MAHETTLNTNSLTSTNDTLNISSEIGDNTYDKIEIHFTPTLTYSTDGTPNDWESGTKELKIEGYELEDDEYRLVISASGGDSTANSSFKVKRTADNTSVEQVNKDRAKKTAMGSSLSNDSSLFYNDKLKFEYTEDTNKYHVVSGYPKLIGGDGSALTADKGICTLGDYAHNAVVNASIVYAVNEYPLTINYGNGGNGGSVSVETLDGTAINSGDKITYGQTYSVTVSPETATHNGTNEDIYSLTALRFGKNNNNSTDNSILSGKQLSGFSGTNDTKMYLNATFSTFSPIMCSVVGVNGTGITAVNPSSPSVQKSNTVTFTATPQEGYYIKTIYGGSYGNGKTAFEQNDVGERTSGTITVWSDINVGSGTEYPVTAEIKKFTISQNVKYSHTNTSYQKCGIQWKYTDADDSTYENLPCTVEYGKSLTFRANADSYNTVVSGPTESSISTVTNNQTISAEFKLKTFTVSFVAKCGTRTLATNDTWGNQTIDYGNKASTPTSTDIDSWLTFSKWDKNISGTTITTDTEFTATYDVKTINVIFKGACEGSVVGDDISNVSTSSKYNERGMVSAPTSVTVPVGYTREEGDKWYSDKACNTVIDLSKQITGLTSGNVVYAKYTAWTITISDKDGKNVTYKYTGNTVDGKFEYSGTNNNGKAFTYYLTKAVNGTINLLTDRSNLFENVEGTMVCLDKVYEGDFIDYYRYPEADTKTQLAYVDIYDASEIEMVDTRM